MTSLSDYKIHSFCGQGTSGAVFSAIHEQSCVAIKFFPKASSQKSLEYQIAKQEFEMLNASKDLPNVLKVLGWGTDLSTDQFFIVTEYLTNIDTSSLDSKQVQKISRGAFKGLKELHRRGISHGDINPGNCLLNKEGEGVLADFGHATYKYHKNYYPIQNPWYRDPRVFIKAPYDHTIDLWGMGCTLFELATNFPLFPGQTFNQLSEPVAYRDLHSMHLIVRLLGYPSREYIVKGSDYCTFFNSAFRLYELPKTCAFMEGNSGINSLKTFCMKKKHTEPFTDQIVSLIGRLVTYGDKISAEDALRSPFYAENESLST